MSEQERECHQILQRILAFFDKEITEAEGDHIREHLFGCENCTSFFNTELAMRSFIKRGCSERAPEGLLERIRESFTTAEGVIA